MIETVLFAGLVNWLATLIIVESFVFEPVRSWVRQGWPGSKLDYLMSCHLCMGTWAGLILALVVPGPFTHPTLFWFLNGLLYKAVGHIVLEITAILKHINSLLNAREGERANGNHRADRDHSTGDHHPRAHQVLAR